MEHHTTAVDHRPLSAPCGQNHPLRTPSDTTHTVSQQALTAMSATTRAGKSFTADADSPHSRCCRSQSEKGKRAGQDHPPWLRSVWLRSVAGTQTHREIARSPDREIAKANPRGSCGVKFRLRRATDAPTYSRAPGYGSFSSGLAGLSSASWVCSVSGFDQWGFRWSRA